ncbi:MAG: tetratricopeptide repeat protein [Cyanobacteriota bacterium]|nr:tetratricopeptide repeat protein [Cyanobacteriota bacterium]
MLNEISDAIKIQDYKTAIRLLKPLLKKDPDDPWLQYYAGRVYEGTGKLESARNIYFKLLPKTTNPKLMAQIRQRIGRLEEIEKKEREQAISLAKSQEGGTKPSLLILEPIASQLKQEAAQKFAKIVQLDPYIARLQLPSRGWRLYRTGSLGELRYLSSKLVEAKIPSFCESLEAIDQLEVLEVNYFLSETLDVVARCQNQDGQEGTIDFDWSEVDRWVEGRLPLFESVVTVDVKHKLQRKTQFQDYVYCVDLHLSSRNCILRLCDRTYQFQQGLDFATPSDPTLAMVGGTVSQSWQKLTKFLRERLPHADSYSDFTPFAETALGFTEMLSRVKPRLDLKRRKETPWDSAFQLYSGLVFLRSPQPRDRHSPIPAS